MAGTLAIANGGTGSTSASGARNNLGATSVGANLFTLTSPNDVTFMRINADNTVSTLDAATFRSAIGAGVGSVTSVNISGGTSGLTASGGPVTSSGTITLGGTLAIANGGTGATDAATARANLGAGTGNGSVTSVALSGGTTGLTVSGSPITSSGTITLAGTLAVANGGTGSTTQSGARAGLGATTVGSNFFTLTNPSAIRFPRINADNTVSALSDSDFRTAIGAGAGTVTSVALSGGTTGLTVTGSPITSSGTITLAGTLAVANGGTGSTTQSGARTGLGATTVGSNLFTLTNPSAVTFPRFNADNTVSALDAATFRSAIGAGAGTVTSVATGTGLTGGTITTSGTLSITNPVLRNVSTGYTSGGQVFVSSTTPTAAAQGDIWFQI
jgi:hypothetical protein